MVFRGLDRLRRGLVAGLSSAWVRRSVIKGQGSRPAGCVSADAAYDHCQTLHVEEAATLMLTAFRLTRAEPRVATTKGGWLIGCCRGSRTMGKRVMSVSS